MFINKCYDMEPFVILHLYNINFILKDSTVTMLLYCIQKFF